MKEIENLDVRPFTRFCISIGAVPSSYLAGLSIEEQLLWLCSYLENEVIPAVNNNAEAVEELQGLFTELKTYVDNYFDNLDVQEEINNKLDDMAESGELEEIIGAYLNTKAVLCFDTVSEMEAAENLVDGSYAQVLGYFAKNDGGKALYKVREIINDDVVDNATIIPLYDDSLIAELITNEVNIMNFGAYGDGTNDDTTAIQKALTFATTKEKNVISPSGKTYLISSPIEIGDLNIDFNNSTIITNDAMDIITIESQNYYGSLKNITIDCNGVATNGINVIHGRKKLIEDVNIINVKYNAIRYYEGYELNINKVHIEGDHSSNSTVGLNMLTSDATITDVIIIDCFKAIINKGQNFYTNVHAWIKTTALCVGSIFADVTGGRFTGVNIYPDTYHYSFYNTGNNQPYIQLSNSYFGWNKNIMTDSAMTDTVPYIFFNGNETVSGTHTAYMLLSNCEINGKQFNSTKVALTNETSFTGSLTNFIYYDVNVGTHDNALTSVDSQLTVATNKLYKITRELNQIDFIASCNGSTLSSRTINVAEIPFAFRPYQAMNYVCTYGATQWEHTGVLYMYINNNGVIQVNVPAAITGTIYIKIHLIYGSLK